MAHWRAESGSETEYAEIPKVTQWSQNSNPKGLPSESYYKALDLMIYNSPQVLYINSQMRPDEQRMIAQENSVEPGDPLSRSASTESCEAPEHAPGTAWFAVQTIYKHEFRVLRDLTAKGFTGYLPLFRETRQWTDRMKIIETPAFSGYLFLRHDSSLRSRSLVLNTLGVFRMLPDNHKPSAIADIEIESLRRALDSNIPCIKCELPAVGTRVRVKSGVLAGVEGQIVRISNKLRLVILVSSISQAISVEVNGIDVEAIADLSSQHSFAHARAWSMTNQFSP